MYESIQTNTGTHDHTGQWSTKTGPVSTLSGTTTTIDLAVIYIQSLNTQLHIFISQYVHFDHKLLQHWDHVGIVETSKHKIIPPYE